MTDWKKRAAVLIAVLVSAFIVGASPASAVGPTQRAFGVDAAEPSGSTLRDAYGCNHSVCIGVSGPASHVNHVQVTEDEGAQAGCGYRAVADFWEPNGSHVQYSDPYSCYHNLVTGFGTDDQCAKAGVEFLRIDLDAFLCSENPHRGLIGRAAEIRCGAGLPSARNQPTTGTALPGLRRHFRCCPMGLSSR
jgi:hypothetical protein